MDGDRRAFGAQLGLFDPPPHLVPPPAATRWRDKVQSWKATQTFFNPREYGYDLLTDRAAKDFVIQHHYSHAYPAARLAVGLFHRPGIQASTLAGVIVFSVPMNQAVVPRYTGLVPSEGAEIGRLVLLPSASTNAESWFITRAFDVLRRERPEIRGLVSYADPVERRDRLGRVWKQQHRGGIYQATNATFFNRTKSRVQVVTPDGEVISERSLSKIACLDRGHAYAEEQLVRLGARPRAGVEPRTWLRQALAEIGAVKRIHPGNYVYAFGLDRAAKRQIAAMAPGFPYPKIEKVAA